MNAQGEGEWSEELSVAMVNPASAPSGLTKVLKQSTKTSTYVTWTLIDDSTLPEGSKIRGYRLYMKHPSVSSEEKLVFDGSYYPKANTANIKGLLTGEEYHF